MNSDLNLLDWGSVNLVALALAGAVYIWNPVSGETHHLIQLEGEDYISSINWIGQGSILGVGISCGQVQVKGLTFINLFCLHSRYHQLQMYFLTGLGLEYKYTE